MLDDMELEKPDLFTDKNKTFLDNSCGDGQFLSEVIIRKMERSNCTLTTFYNLWSRTYGR